MSNGKTNGEGRVLQTSQSCLPLRQIGRLRRRESIRRLDPGGGDDDQALWAGGSAEVADEIE